MAKLFQFLCRGKCDGFSTHVVIDQKTDDPLFNYSKVQCVHGCCQPFVVEHHKDQDKPTELSQRVQNVHVC